MEATTANGNLLVVTSEEEIQRLLDEAVDATLSRALSAHLPPGREPPKEVLSNREAMEFLDLSKSTLQRYRDGGVLPYSKLGGNVYYEREDLLRVVREHRVNEEAPAGAHASS